MSVLGGGKAGPAVPFRPLADDFEGVRQTRLERDGSQQVYLSPGSTKSHGPLTPSSELLLTALGPSGDVIAKVLWEPASSSGILRERKY